MMEGKWIVQLTGVGFLVAACSINGFVESSTFMRTLYHNFSNIEDYKKFPYRMLAPSEHSYYFEKMPNNVLLPKVRVEGKKRPLKELLDETETVAFLMIKNDKIVYERYWGGFDKDTLAMTFSVTKSIVSSLMGFAIAEGLVSSVEQPVTDFIPELKKNGFENVKIKHLLQMTSGLDYTENDNPFGIHSRSYQRAMIEETIINFRLKNNPGEVFEYKSGDTLIAGLILSRVLSPRTLTDYLQEKIWTPLGMESSGLWNIYEDGFEKSFCCLSATARDLAKFGRLYLHGGRWQNRQLLPEAWVKLSTQWDTSEGSVWFYQYGWYVMSKKYGDFRAEGVRGQFVYVNPTKDLIVVRLGRERGISWDAWREVFSQLADSTN